MHGLALGSDSGEPYPWRSCLGRGQETCHPPFSRPVLEAQAERPVENWSLCNSLQYVCNNRETEKMLI